MAKVSFYITNIEGKIDKEIQALLDYAGQQLAYMVQRNIGIQGPPRSTPDEYPRMDTRELHNSVVYWTSGDEVFVTSEAPHTPHVEVIRPFLTRTLEEGWNELQDYLSQYQRRGA